MVRKLIRATFPSEALADWAVTAQVAVWALALDGGVGPGGVGLGR